MIEVINITKKFGDISALSQVSFEVPQGRIMGFLGANGAGKTTTMDIICGCLGPDDGTVLIQGIDIIRDPIKAKRKIGYLPDEPPLHNDMIVRDFLKYVGQIRGMTHTQASKRLSVILDRLSLEQVQSRLIGNLSKGFRQRVGLAQAIFHEPEVLVLDEPTEGLDPQQISEIRLLIRSLKEDHTIVLSSHILTEVESTCDDITIIDRGQVLVQGGAEQLRRSLTSESQYVLTVCRDVANLGMALMSMPGVRAVHPDKDGRKLNISVDPGYEDFDPLLKAVMDGGHGIQEFAKKKSSLEDVFMKLTNHQQQESRI